MSIENRYNESEAQAEKAIKLASGVQTRVSETVNTVTELIGDEKRYKESQERAENSVKGQLGKYNNAVNSIVDIRGTEMGHQINDASVISTFSSDEDELFHRLKNKAANDEIFAEAA